MVPLETDAPTSAKAPTRAPWRANGILVLIVLVVVGMGATSVLFHLRAPELYERMQRTRAETPKEGEPRVELWLEYGRPFIHARMVQLRYSSSQPWLVTHTIGADREHGEVEIWGVDLTDLSPESTSRDAMTVVLTLPRPRLLARGPFGHDGNDMARNVPHYATADAAPDAQERARSMVSWALDRLTAALRRDIAGVQFEVRFRAEEGAGDAGTGLGG